MTNRKTDSHRSRHIVTSDHFSEAIPALVSRMSEETVSVAQIAQFMERRSIGTLLLIFALPMVIPVPAPGISVIFGVPLIIISAQLFLGMTHVWLPAHLGKRRITRDSLNRLAETARPWLSTIEKLARPRFGWLVGNRTTFVSGAACLVMAVIITLPIPLGHFVPGGAISLIALGLIERDGLFIGAGLVVSILAIVVVTIASSALMTLIQSMIGSA